MSISCFGFVVSRACQSRHQRLGCQQKGERITYITCTVINNNQIVAIFTRTNAIHVQVFSATWCSGTITNRSSGRANQHGEHEHLRDQLHAFRFLCVASNAPMIMMSDVAMDIRSSMRPSNAPMLQRSNR